MKNIRALALAAGVLLSLVCAAPAFASNADVSADTGSCDVQALIRGDQGVVIGSVVQNQQDVSTGQTKKMTIKGSQPGTETQVDIVKVECALDHELVVETRDGDPSTVVEEGTRHVCLASGSNFASAGTDLTKLNKYLYISVKVAPAGSKKASYSQGGKTIPVDCDNLNKPVTPAPGTADNKGPASPDDQATLSDLAARMKAQTEAADAAKANASPLVQSSTYADVLNGDLEKRLAAENGGVISEADRTYINEEKKLAGIAQEVQEVNAQEAAMKQKGETIALETKAQLDGLTTQINDRYDGTLPPTDKVNFIEMSNPSVIKPGDPTFSDVSTPDATKESMTPQQKFEAATREVEDLQAKKDACKWYNPIACLNAPTDEQISDAQQKADEADVAAHLTPEGTSPEETAQQVCADKSSVGTQEYEDCLADANGAGLKKVPPNPKLEVARSNLVKAQKDYEACNGDAYTCTVARIKLADAKVAFNSALPDGDPNKASSFMCNTAWQLTCPNALAGSDVPDSVIQKQAALDALKSKQDSCNNGWGVFLATCSAKGEFDGAVKSAETDLNKARADAGLPPVPNAPSPESTGSVTPPPFSNPLPDGTCANQYQILVNGKCIDQVSTPCPAGQTRVDGECMSDASPTSPAPVDTTSDSYKCWEQDNCVACKALGVTNNTLCPSSPTEDDRAMKACQAQGKIYGTDGSCACADGTVPKPGGTGCVAQPNGPTSKNGQCSQWPGTAIDSSGNCACPQGKTWNSTSNSCAASSNNGKCSQQDQQLCQSSHDYSACMRCGQQQQQMPPMMQRPMMQMPMPTMQQQQQCNQQGGQISGGGCQQVCQGGQQLNPYTQQCQQQCPYGQQLSTYSGQCSQPCPQGQQQNPQTGQCSQICPNNQQPNPTTGQCANQCTIPGQVVSVLGGQCACPQGMTVVNNVCTSQQCQITGQTLDPSSGQCACPLGQQVVGSSCTTPVTLTASLTCSKSTADPGSTVLLTWKCTSADSSSGTNFDTGGSLDRSAEVKIPTTTGGKSSITYAVTCTKTGSQPATKSCTVNFLKSVIVLLANPSSVARGQSSTIKWYSTGIQDGSCHVSSPQDQTFTNGNSSHNGAKDEVVMQNITGARDVTVSCTTTGGTPKSETTHIQVK